MFRLFGGWGYDNLGDEAILSGYCRALATIGCQFGVYSINPYRTRRANGPGVERAVWLRNEASLLEYVRAPTENSCLLLCGGGYLNGTWSSEVGGKLRRGLRLSQGSDLGAHGVELRRLDGARCRTLSAKLLSKGRVFVRDPKSALEASQLGVRDCAIGPDSIALMYHEELARWQRKQGTDGPVLVNFHDITLRGDVDEAEFDTENWEAFARELVHRLRGSVVGLALSAEDRRYMTSVLGLRSIFPHSVDKLTSTIRRSNGIITTRMHPGLIASQLGVPTVAIPYCGKVRPTLTRIGVQHLILERLDAKSTIDQMVTVDNSHEWRSAHDESLGLLESFMR